MTATEAHGAIEAVWRIESAKLIAGLMRIVRDVGVAEDLAHDALVAALEQWPESGVPRNPGAWLMAAAKHRAIDLFRRHSASFGYVFFMIAQLPALQTPVGRFAVQPPSRQ
jgi:predicted RNA polymerase sigma factor